MAKKLVFTTNNPSATTDYAAADGTWKTMSGGGGGGGPQALLHGTASGTDTYTVSLTGVTSYADGDAYLVKFTNGNTTGCTLNVNSLGAKDLYRNNDGLLIGGDIENGAEMLCIYDTTINGFQVIGTSPNTLLAYVTNAESVTITKGQPVYAFGGVGDRLKVKLAYNTTDATSAQTVGLVLSSSIAANQKGLIIVNGQLDGLSILPTSTFADGDPVYLGATAGTITNVKPSAPNHLVYLGFVTTASPGSAGRMYVRVQNGYEMDEIHDVQVGSYGTKDVLWRDTSVNLWKNKDVFNLIGATSTEVGYLSGVTSAIQTQLNGKQGTITLTTTGNSGAATLVGNTLNVPQYASFGSGTCMLYSNVQTGTTIAAGATVYGGFINGTYQNLASEYLRMVVFPKNAVMGNFVVYQLAQPASGSAVWTVRKNGVDTALVITVPAGSAAAFHINTTTTVSFTALDYITVKCQNNASASITPVSLSIIAAI